MDVDSVVTVIDELDNKCWLIALIVFVMEDALLPILLNDIDDVFCVEALLELDVVELLPLLIFVPFSLLAPFALLLLLFRDARLLARAEIRRFKSSRRSDFSGDTYKLTDWQQNFKIFGITNATKKDLAKDTHKLRDIYNQQQNYDFPKETISLSLINSVKSLPKRGIPLKGKEMVSS